MRQIVFALIVLLQSIAFAGEKNKNLLQADVHVDAEQFQLQRMVTKPVLHYKNPVRKLYEDPALNFAARIAVEYVENKNREKSYYKNEILDPKRIR